MMTQFSFMCPTTSGSTAILDLHLQDSLPFKQICNQKSVTIEYIDHWTSSDIEISGNKLVERSNENGYSKTHKRIPDFDSQTNSVGETDIMSSFLKAQNFTDVNWIHAYDNIYQGYMDISVTYWTCSTYITQDFQCLPSDRYEKTYIWTRYPEAQSQIIM